MRTKLYRIIDSWTGEILANQMTHAQALAHLEIMELEYPHIDLEIETYNNN